MKKTLIFLFFVCLLLPVFAQQQDSLTHAKDSIARAKAVRKLTYSGPRKASIMSTILPGLGQAYNRKIWKIPIIYAGLGGFGYLFLTSNTNYNYYRKNLIAANGPDPKQNSTRYSSDQLEVLKLSWRKKRDTGIIGLVIVYILNIVDANVDAHLKTFDVSDDLSIQVEPWQTMYNMGGGYGTATGLSVKLNFK